MKTHINNIFAKTGVTDRAQAVRYAYTHGLADPAAHGFADPAAHGFADPAAHGFADPAAHGFADPGTVGECWRPAAVRPDTAWLRGPVTLGFLG